jgi:hypothetical protein
MDKETDIEYMSFANARRLMFNNKHQPSLAASTLR